MTTSLSSCCQAPVKYVIGFEEINKPIICSECLQLCQISTMKKLKITNLNGITAEISFPSNTPEEMRNEMEKRLMEWSKNTSELNLANIKPPTSTEDIDKDGSIRLKIETIKNNLETSNFILDGIKKLLENNQ